MWVKSLRPWSVVDRSSLPCDANRLNWQKNGSLRTATSRAAAPSLRGLVWFYPHEILKSHKAMNRTGMSLLTQLALLEPAGYGLHR